MRTVILWSTVPARLRHPNAAKIHGFINDSLRASAIARDPINRCPQGVWRDGSSRMERRFGFFADPDCAGRADAEFAVAAAQTQGFRAVPEVKHECAGGFTGPARSRHPNTPNIDGFPVIRCAQLREFRSEKRNRTRSDNRCRQGGMARWQ